MDGICKNCGATAPSRFCAECGQSTAVSVPSFANLLHDLAASVFSYDSRMLRTLRTLVTRPGELSAAYVEGKRARYISPMQLFVWLEAAAFFVNRVFFDTDQSVNEAKSRDLLLVGLLVAVFLALTHFRSRGKAVEHLVFAIHVWSFLMIVLLAEYAAMPYLSRLILYILPHSGFREGIAVTIVAMAAMAVYTPVAIVRFYRDRWPLALLQTALMIGLYVPAELQLQRYLHPNIRL